ncbi:phosphodiester glycosidase family protein [Demequina sp. SYSU T00192]|uniref:Phosphodiester glycosidase family protein n=1 Tax=Demequina litoralis TaxID=3051660 RepID=A0ABT8G5H2_9MICO|nr:phosphodiester glycosidase family protein [Demequina sp. SYSU T00192]MDN4474385.1 phosphodiester glycosidase family protein [Demequina sp. SYSU T00192]
MTSTAASRPHRLRRRIVAAAATFLLALAAVTAWALDRYVLDHVEVANASAYEAEVAADANEPALATAATDDTDAVAEDAADITVTEHTYGSGDDQATYYVADVVLSDITQLRSAFAQDAFGENIVEYPSDIAADVGAALAINGDYYGFRTTGIEIRNGVIYRDEPAREGAVIYADGTMEVYDETTTSAQELLDAGAWQTLSFGPALVDDGEIVDGIDQVEVDTNFGNHSIQGDQPRTAIGMIDANHYVLVVVDGRSSESAGVTLTELAEIMTDLGATEAYNLDGGGSSTMVSDGSVVNVPGRRGEERGTSDILWVG